MSFRMIRHRRDATHSEVVEALTKAGYIVEDDMAVDLVVRHPTWILNTWVKLENKVRNRKDGFTPRADQQHQTDYCRAHGVPYIFSAEDALHYLSIHGLKLMETA